MKEKIIEEDDPDFDLKKVKYIAGMDVSLSNDPEFAHLAIATMCVMEYPSLKVVYEKHVQREYDIPYCPGFLAFK